MGKAILAIDEVDVLNYEQLPSGVRIVTAEIVIEHDALPEVDGPLPRVIPCMRDQCGVRVFDRWQRV